MLWMDSRFSCGERMIDAGKAVCICLRRKDGCAIPEERIRKGTNRAVCAYKEKPLLGALATRIRFQTDCFRKDGAGLKLYRGVDAPSKMDWGSFSVNI